MPTVHRLNIAAVRSLALETRDEIDLTESGVAEDRRFYLIGDDGRMVDQIMVPGLVRIRTWSDPGATVLRLTFPDGTVVEDRVRTGDPTETAIYSRVSAGHVVDGPWAEALTRYAGRSIRVVRCDQAGGTWATDEAVTLVTDGSLEAIGAALGVETLDARRFRMLIELEGGAPHEEDTWAGRRIGLGETILRVGAPVPRCPITTHDPGTGERDLDTLRAIKDYRGISGKKDLLFGVWAEVERPGRIRLGDAVTILD